MLKNIFRDIGQCITFYTRVPVPLGEGPFDFARAQWAAPLVGGLIGGIGAGFYYAAILGGLSVTLAALLTICATILLTGALHEDGFADVADGFGGGNTTERKLEIMKDSRIGTYGVLALIASFAVRGFALNEIANPATIAGVLIAAHMGSRALIPAFMRSLNPARNSGLAQGVGQVPAAAASIAIILGALGLALMGPLTAGVTAMGFGLWFIVLRHLAKTQINGHTGDVLGTLQQGGEAIVLICASVLL